MSTNEAPIAWLIQGGDSSFLQFAPTIADADIGLLTAHGLYHASYVEGLRGRIRELEVEIEEAHTSINRMLAIGHGNIERRNEAARRRRLAKQGGQDHG
jgi:hypothetical protein